MSVNIMSDLRFSTTGLEIPDNCTEDQFFEWGMQLGKLEKGMQWAIGDWYNKIPSKFDDPESGGKKAACQRAGIDPASATIYAKVCRNFNSSRRLEQLKFEHYREASYGTNEKQKIDLIAYALNCELGPDGKPVGTTNKEGNAKPLSIAQVRSYKKELLGKVEPKADERLEKEAERKTENLLSQIPIAQRSKVSAHIKWYQDRFLKDFWIHVEKEAKEKLKPERESLKNLMRENERLNKSISDRSKSMDSLLTKEEYNVIRRCLVSDRQPEELRKRFDKAAAILEKLKQSVDIY